MSRTLTPVLAAALLTLTLSCGTGLTPSAANEGFQPAVAPAATAPTPAAATAAAPATAAPAKAVAPAPGIPARPEDIVFPKFTFVPPSPDSFRSVLAAGPVVYSAEDHELPLVSISVTLRGGTYLSPRGKEGLAELAGALLTRGGTRTRRAKDLDEELAFLAAQLDSSFDVDRGVVSLNLLSKDLDQGLAILKEVMTEPAFEEERLLLRKRQMLADMRTRNDDAADIESRERAVLSLGSDFFINRLPTKASVEAITRQDLVAFHRRVFDPRNFLVTASGDFDRRELLVKLEAFFASWPVRGEASPPIPHPTQQVPSGLFFVDKDVNQGRVSVVVPGLLRSDPDYTAAEVMNEVLGGNGDTSRITNAVRSEEGLAYDARSLLTGGVWFPGTWRASLQSKSRSVTYATEIVLGEMRKMKDAGPSDGELDVAKRSIVDTLARRFSTKSQTVGVFADEEYTGRYTQDPAYYARYRERHLAVTKDDVSRVAHRLFDSPPVAILVVGKRGEITNPLPAHPVALASLAKTPVVDVPLKDPMTLQPLAAAREAR